MSARRFSCALERATRVGGPHEGGTVPDRLVRGLGGDDPRPRQIPDVPEYGIARKPGPQVSKNEAGTPAVATA